MHAQAQACNASLTGAIYDSSGTAVPGAKVTLSDPEKGFMGTFTTESDGRQWRMQCVFCNARESPTQVQGASVRAEARRERPLSRSGWCSRSTLGPDA